MSGPANIGARRQVMSLDNLIDQLGGGPGWDGVRDRMQPAESSDKHRPDAAILKEIALMWDRPQERAGLEWIFDITSRAPYPTDHSDIERMAMAAAKHMARAAVGEAIALAIDEGRKILEQQRSTA